MKSFLSLFLVPLLPRGLDRLAGSDLTKELTHLTLCSDGATIRSSSASLERRDPIPCQAQLLPRLFVHHRQCFICFGFTWVLPRQAPHAVWRHCSSISSITCRLTISTEDCGCMWNRSQASRPSHIVCPREYSTAGYSGSSNIPSRIVSERS
jgi:hypothetical protein